MTTTRWRPPGTFIPLLLVLDRLHGPSPFGPPRAPASDDRWNLLTRRERDVADLLCAGLTSGAIGRVLGISPRTVEKHLENAYRKLGIHDRLRVALDGMRRAGIG